MKAMKNVIDTWNIIERFGIMNFTTTNNTIEISNEDYKKIYNGCTNKIYINNLLSK